MANPSPPFDPTLPGTVLAQFAQDPGARDFGFPPHTQWLLFQRPERIIEAFEPAAVSAAWAQASAAAQAGRWLAGWVAYEAAPGFDPALTAQSPQPGFPLIWLGVYKSVEFLTDLPSRPPAPCMLYSLSPWQPELTEQAYGAHIQRIRQWIAAGDTYQVNFTYRQRAAWRGDPYALWLDLHRAQGGTCSVYARTAAHTVASASPELFFAQAGGRVVTRPMKGTAPRGRWLEEDRRRVAQLAASPKDRAENLMIVDLLRNDLGRLAHPGSVQVPGQFEIERYRTVLQMTSTVTARTAASPPQVLAALFPCGSVTGAPKVRTCQLIAQTEASPRGVYTGALGWMGPGGRARMNVAIRTVQIDHRRREALYGVGSGITWDSSPGGEYSETRDKARVLQPAPPRFELLETMLVSEGRVEGLTEHLERLEDSALYFGFACPRGQIQELLEQAAAATQGSTRLRLQMDRHGRAAIDTAPFTPGPSAAPWRVALAKEPVDPADSMLYHKTTLRERYEAARRAQPTLDDVILWNTRGELTESTIANIVIEKEGRLLTPPVACGLLPGTQRRRLLGQGRLKESVLIPEDLFNARCVWLINSLRGWVPVQVTPSTLPNSYKKVSGFFCE